MPVYHHARNLRIGRYSCHGQIYLVSCAVQNREPVFANLYVGRQRVAEMRRLHDAGVVQSLAGL